MCAHSLTTLKPMVGMVHTTSPSFSLYKTDVFPAPSKPMTRPRKVAGAPKSEMNRLKEGSDMSTRWVLGDAISNGSQPPKLAREPLAAPLPRVNLLGVLENTEPYFIVIISKWSFKIYQQCP